MIPVEKLKKLAFFREAPPAAVERLAKEMGEKSFRAGEVILSEGQESGALYLIASGAVTIEKRLDKTGERSKVIARLGAEEFFGELAFIERQPHSATVVAQEASAIYYLPRQSLDDLIRKDPASAVDQILTLLVCVSSRLRRTTQDLVTLFEVARVVGRSMSLAELASQVVSQLLGVLSEGTSAAFYRWNPFNEEFTRFIAAGPHQNLFPDEIPAEADLLRMGDADIESLANLSAARNLAPFSCKEGHLVMARSRLMDADEGLFLFYSPRPASFRSGDRQVIETVSAVLAPALGTARMREEEEARVRFQRKKGSSI